MEKPSVEEMPARRSFFREALAIGLGGIAAVTPFVTGLVFYLNPLKRKKGAGDDKYIRVTTLDSLPGDDVPRQFPVLGSKTDAWTRTEAAPLGAVFLRRNAAGEIKAFSTICPHAGCFVEYLGKDKNKFLCPCHDSEFELNGDIASPGSPSPRGLDPIEVEVRNESEVWVMFQKFQTGSHDRIPVG